MNVTRSGPNAFSLSLGGQTVDTVARKLNDGGLLIQVYTLLKATPQTKILMAIEDFECFPKFLSDAC